MRFIDEVEFIVISGKGGDGCASFRREKFIPRGGPDGGDGGRGGAIIFEASRRRNTLSDFRRNKQYKAPGGRPGMGRQMNGAAGEDTTLLVPVGTVLYDAETDEALADLDVEGARFILPGGRGGLGNIHFKSSTRRTPRYASPGRPGIELRVRAELKLLADVGLLGFPNAGKSTLISRLSAARPKVADYPFTTLVPQLGVVELSPGESFVMADIPGLIEGAAEGIGLGHRFLRHVERCAAYVHLVAPDAPQGPPEALYQTLREELGRYDPALLDRPQIVVLSKVDLLDAETREAHLRALEAASGATVKPLSAITGEGLRELVYALYPLIQAQREATAADPSDDPPSTTYLPPPSSEAPDDPEDPST